MIPDLEALDFLAEEIREAAEMVYQDWPQILTPDELTARISCELIDREGADDLASIEPRSKRMWLLLKLATAIVDRERVTYENGTGIELIPTSRKAIS